MLASSDARVRKVAKLIQAKNDRPPFHVWILSQVTRQDGVGRCARWLRKRLAVDGGFPLGIGQTPPANALASLERSKRLGRMKITNAQIRDAAEALEEWDRWGA
jgi:hypothetical protein